MEQHHSTLELVKYDESAKAPERDDDATAFELDASALAPQVVPDTAPQLLHSNSSPEVLGEFEDSAKEPLLSHHTTKAAGKWPWMVVALIAVAIAVGAGVGTWRHHKHLSEQLSSTMSPSGPQNHSSTRAPQYILNDTSLAALSLASGDRQLIFQDSSGQIQRVVRSASNGRWSTSSHINVTAFSDGSQPRPKKNTPLAVILHEVETDMSIEMFYVSDSHHLASLFLNTIDKNGFTYLPPIPITERDYSTAVDTRSLSVTLIPFSYSEGVPKNFTGNTALLYYENANGNVSALLRRLTTGKNGGLSLPWVDITSQDEHHGNPSDAPRVDEFSNGPNFDLFAGFSHTLHESVNNTSLTAPFTCKANFSSVSKAELTSMGALFYAPGNASLVVDYFDIGPSGPGNYSGFASFDLVSYEINGEIESSNHLNYSLIGQSDVVTVGQSDAIWINGTQPVTFRYAPLNISFPFTRLASVNSADQSMTFLYHQINGTTFAEETWDDALNFWYPTEYITLTQA